MTISDKFCDVPFTQYIFNNVNVYLVASVIDHLYVSIVSNNLDDDYPWLEMKYVGL
jgi:hypothetical protein